MELIRRVDENQPGLKELFKWNGEHLIVSTVDLGESIKLASPGSRAVADLANRIFGTPGTGEETMAFRCDASGLITDWGEVAVARGEGSRDAVLNELNEKEYASA